MTGVNVPDWWPRREPGEPVPEPVTVCNCLTTTPLLCEPRLPGQHDPACPNSMLAKIREAADKIPDPTPEGLDRLWAMLVEEYPDLDVSPGDPDTSSRP